MIPDAASAQRRDLAQRSCVGVGYSEHRRHTDHDTDGDYTAKSRVATPGGAIIGGDDSSSVTLTGTAAEINTALATASYIVNPTPGLWLRQPDRDDDGHQ